MVRGISRWAALAMLVFGMSAGVAADADKELRDKALKLNEVTGLTVMEGHLRAMIKEADATKKLLGVAGKMAQEKPQPFNYNAAFVLARAAHNLKDVDNAQRFYRVCRDEAFKLQ